MDESTATISPEVKQEATPEKRETITGIKEGAEENSLAKQVVDLTAETERLSRELTQTKTLQSQSDRKARQESVERKKVEAELRRIQKGEGSIIPEVGEEISGTAISQKILVKSLVMETILRNKDYQTILEQDPTLQEVLLTNPLAIVEDAYDAEDALNQIKEKLDLRVNNLKAFQKKVEQPKEGGAEFSAGPINVSEGTSPEIKTPSKKALEEGNIEKSILSKIKIT